MASDDVLRTQVRYFPKMRLCATRLWVICSARRKLLGIIAALYVVIYIAVHNQRNISFEHLKLSWTTTSSFSNLSLSAPSHNVSSNSNAIVDIHIEDPKLGHTGEVLDEFSEEEDSGNMTKIGIGGAITSKKLKGLTPKNLESSLQVFTTFLPSFCSTVSPGYNLQFYFGYDYNDATFSSSNFTQAFADSFVRILTKNCPKPIQAGVHFVQCSHEGKPTWAQNDAMLEAYLDNVDYFYRINDDTRLQTKGWVEEFIKTLKSYDPPNVGVVGPRHSGGNTNILTYDFVHRTHVDIFGFYYPKLFTDWWGDDWITIVYRPGRSTKLDHIRLAHTMTLGQRYNTDHSVGQKLQGRLDIDRVTLNRYLEGRNASARNSDGQKRVISLTLHGKNPKYTWGAIRNAQLSPIIYPGWIMRFYIPHPGQFPHNETVPVRIVRKLKQLGAEIVFMNNTSKIPQKYWKYAVTMDSTVDYFMVRNVDSRISDREAVVVNEWMHKFNKTSIHCIRDHPKHAQLPIVEGLWGGNTKKLNEALKGKNLFELVQEYLSNSSSFSRNFNQTLITNSSSVGNESLSFLHFLWSFVSESILCHDSVSCDRWKHSVSFPVERVDGMFVGRKFDERQEPVEDPVTQAKESFPKCDAKNI